MKILSVHLGSTNIVFDYCIWSGYESIYFNGLLVSKQFSWLRRDHTFEVEENGTWVEYMVTTGFGWRGITADVHRNGVYIIKGCGMGTYRSLSTPETMLYSENDLV